MLNPALFSSATDNWATPQDVFDRFNYVFNFTLDPCADSKNAKCDLYFTKEDDGLSKDWGGHNDCHLWVSLVIFEVRREHNQVK